MGFVVASVICSYRKIWLPDEGLKAFYAVTMEQMRLKNVIVSKA
ncbi:hypothetical protein Z948_2065 [Sulfitobacter donghicola DSW-25 = KCTC 12864 = JCM 14565]|nr:hypothetical protein Z948_2065 [Sulfitobacter donghicola DSW-25 = KCTC 12864 = JCM 14565]